ncbi:hypothetical protein KM043_008578 [Ampulex compressa]|nr:hypothetical protein KM043_008578 [Ampulex compressa]
MWLLQTGGIVGRTWFLETLLPSGRKHRAPGYELARPVFRERYISVRGSYPRILDEKTALPPPALVSPTDSLDSAHGFRGSIEIIDYTEKHYPRVVLWTQSIIYPLAPPRNMSLDC